MDDKNQVYDFIIIGCGPTGSTAATYLTKLGYSVVVFEKAKFPRRHEGESLLPFCYEIFKDLGVWEEMKTKFVRKPGARFTSQDGTQSSTWCFKSVIPHEGYLSFNVFRPQFDLMLMNNTKKHGVKVLEETKVEAVNLDRPDKIVEVDTINEQDGYQKWHGRFLIDASGQDTFVAKRMGIKNAYKELDRIAFLGHWKGAKYANGLEVGLLNIVYMEQSKKGWLALQPVGKDLLSVTLTVERKYLKERKKELADQGVEDWQRVFYKQEIDRCVVSKEALVGAEMSNDLLVTSDYSYFADKMFGDNFALLGDAYKFLDPIFSTGVFLGMKSAKLFAEAIHTKLNSGKEAGDKIFQKTFDDISGAYGLVAKFINIFYDPESFNLSSVNARSESGYEGHENAFALLHLLLAGDFFTNYKKYGEFLSLLKTPDQFQRWKSLVVSVPNEDVPSCNMSYNEAYAEIIG